ncbi:MAG: type III pantothenate kinase [Thiomicrospira sp.]|uniref:type III pantothenate kinase n=1 Tax=Thiomicrospira sp. TaxID=935 RepID=UPI0019F2B79F|nr:type III pantothenate kinase [Thiomicrospira sp.]MBE0493196.1 type III pantothenate kinase [Thiomicrospira sp.]
MNWLIDFGNSNVKWSYVFKNKYISGESLDYSALTPAELIEVIYKTISERTHPKTVLIASVGKSEFVSPFCKLLSRCSGADVRLIESPKVLLGVTSSYVNPRQLGIDRLLAMGAAYQLSQSACIVVDIGTAITLDCIDQSGHHLGGLIVPGTDLMLESLKGESSKLATNAQFNAFTRSFPLLGKSTNDAMLSGIHYLIVHFIREHVQIIKKTLLNDQVPLVFLTGGGSNVFVESLGDDWLFQPNLVLQGLHFFLISKDYQ